MRALRVRRRGGVYRVVCAASGRVALDEDGQALDGGGARRRVKMERVVRQLERERAHRERYAGPRGVVYGVNPSQWVRLVVEREERDRGVVSLAEAPRW